jgi:hypothetical protein
MPAQPCTKLCPDLATCDGVQDQGPIDRFPVIRRYFYQEVFIVAPNVSYPAKGLFKYEVQLIIEK